MSYGRSGVSSTFLEDIFDQPLCWMTCAAIIFHHENFMLHSMASQWWIMQQLVSTCFFFNRLFRLLLGPDPGQNGGCSRGFGAPRPGLIAPISAIHYSWNNQDRATKLFTVAQWILIYSFGHFDGFHIRCLLSDLVSKIGFFVAVVVSTRPIGRVDWVEITQPRL